MVQLGRLFPLRCILVQVRVLQKIQSDQFFYFQVVLDYVMRDSVTH